MNDFSTLFNRKRECGFKYSPKNTIKKQLIREFFRFLFQKPQVQASLMDVERFNCHALVV